MKCSLSVLTQSGSSVSLSFSFSGYRSPKYGRKSQRLRSRDVAKKTLTKLVHEHAQVAFLAFETPESYPYM